MERRRQARTPVNINALLIGEKTVPKGCRVINVSQYGMLLYCEADGRLSTFNDGDNVDIHLAVQHAGEQKKLTIPSYVRHVADNSVDVEFHQPDPILMDLIESYRVSDKHKLEASLGQKHSVRDRATRISSISPPAVTTQEKVPHTTPASGHRTFYLGMLILIFTVCVAAGGYVYTASVDDRISTLESFFQNQSEELKELQNRMFSTSLQEGRYASLNARITALGDAFAHLEDKLTMLLPVAGTTQTGGEPGNADAGTDEPAGSMPAALPLATNTVESEELLVEPSPMNLAQPPQPTIADAGTPAVSPKPDTQTIPSATTRPEEKSSTDMQVAAPPVASAPEQTAMSTASTGPWVINLLSSPDKGDIDRFARLATAANIATTIEQAEVKGKRYWRLQTGGYSSFAEAKQHAEPIKLSLKIRDVWIFKRK
jgi:hypothetical protein